MVFLEVLDTVRVCIRGTVPGITSQTGQVHSLSIRDMRKVVWLDKDQVPVLLGLTIGM